MPKQYRSLGFLAVLGLVGCQAVATPVGMDLGAVSPVAVADSSFDLLATTGCAASTYAVFANSSTQEMAVTGGSNRLQGTVHTNQALRMAGNQDTVVGTAETVAGLTISGKSDSVNAKQTVAVAGFPFVPQTSLLTPTFSFTGDVDLKSRPEVWASATQLKPGVYKTTGKLTISGHAISGTVTLVGASVDIHCEQASLQPAVAGILAYATGKGGIGISGSSNGLNGLCYAPAGDFQLTGSSNTLLGCVLADTARVAGNSNVIAWKALAGLCASPAPTPSTSVKPSVAPSTKPSVAPPTKPSEAPKPTPTPKATPKPAPTPTPKPTPTPACWKVSDKPLIGHNWFWSIWDPHERSGDGALWDNQQYGQVELLRSASNDLVMQVDQGAEVFGRWSGYTVNHRVAVKDGSDVVIYDGLHGTLTVNGQPRTIAPSASAIMLPCGGRMWIGSMGIEILTSKRDDLGILQLVDCNNILNFGLPGGKNRPDFCNLQGTLGSRKCGEVRGGLGAFDGDGNPCNDLKGRCGEQPVANPDDEASLPRFNNEWRVQPGQSLFR